MVMTSDSMRGGKPNPGTSKDGRLKGNKGGKGMKRSDDSWAQDLANKSGGLPSKSGPVNPGK